MEIGSWLRSQQHPESPIRLMHRRSGGQQRCVWAGRRFRRRRAGGFARARARNAPSTSGIFFRIVSSKRRACDKADGAAPRRGVDFMRSRGSACGVCILEAMADTPGSKARYAAFLEGLQQLGWTPGRNVQIEVRYAEGDEFALRKYAAELETDAIPQIQGRRYRYPEAGDQCFRSGQTASR
jgi:hypothetical protein